MSAEICKKAIEILGLTNDGDNLKSIDLWLVQQAVNDHLTEKGIEDFLRLHVCVTKKIKSMTCHCCGDETLGRQWYNRDNGYGTCDRCVKWLGERGEDVERLCGVAGVHHSITDK